MGGGGGEGRLTNTNFFPTTFRVQDFSLHIDLFFGIKLLEKKALFIYFFFPTSIGFLKTLLDIISFAVRFPKYFRKKFDKCYSF